MEKCRHSSDSEETEAVDNKLEKLFCKIAESSALIKCQQRGDPDLTTKEKIKILEEIFTKSPGNFLSRFKCHLDISDISCFENVKSDDYEVKFYLGEIRRFNTTKGHHIQTRNRRYKYMKELESKSDYFEFENMRQRSPLLFEQFVGKYMSEIEITDIKRNVKRSNCLSEFLLGCVENTHHNVKYCIERTQQNDKKDSLVEEDDDSDDDVKFNNIYQEDGEEDDTKSLSKIDKELLQQDFLAIMQERFLNGEEEIDYSAIDNNDAYDSLDIREHDEEEKYFDED